MELSEDVEQFKIFLPLPLLLFTAMRKDFSMLMHARPHTSYLSFARSEPHIIMTAASLVAISAVGGGIGVSMISNTNDAIVQSNAATYTDTTGTYTQKEVYYKLREWAHCHVEMEQKTSAEFQEILPYYSFLKELNSPYYIKLKAYNHWAEDFEKNLK